MNAAVRVCLNLSVALAVGCNLGLAGCGAPPSAQNPNHASAPHHSAAQTPPQQTPAPPPATHPPPPPAPPPPPPPPDPGRANLDPTDDDVVGPPAPIVDCEKRLAAAGVSFKAAKLPVRTQASGAQCGAEQVVVYEKGPTGIAWNARPTVTCQMALGLARFEKILQEEAQAQLGTTVKRIQQGGTYSCRKMARFAMRSEHSYANAMDVYGFSFENGTSINIKLHFGKLSEEPDVPTSKFLRRVARRAFAEDVFSVVLTPFWDKLHADHLHLDQARYRVNATSARE